MSIDTISGEIRRKLENYLLRGNSLTHQDANFMSGSPEGSRTLRRICNSWNVSEEWRANKGNNGRHKIFYLSTAEIARITEARNSGLNDRIIDRHDD